jgi:hypothetical protein
VNHYHSGLAKTVESKRRRYHGSSPPAKSNTGPFSRIPFCFSWIDTSPRSIRTWLRLFADPSRRRSHTNQCRTSHLQLSLNDYRKRCGNRMPYSITSALFFSAIYFEKTLPEFIKGRDRGATVFLKCDFLIRLKRITHGLTALRAAQNLPLTASTSTWAATLTGNLVIVLDEFVPREPRFPSSQSLKALSRD